MGSLHPVCGRRTSVEIQGCLDLEPSRAIRFAKPLREFFQAERRAAAQTPVASPVSGDKGSQRLPVVVQPCHGAPIFHKEGAPLDGVFHVYRRFPLHICLGPLQDDLFACIIQNACYGEGR